MMVCADCGRASSDDTVVMFDECLGCGARPFPEIDETK